MSQITFMDEAALLGQHFRKPKERPFLLKEKEKTTILFSGLPLNYEHLIKGALESSGYKAEYLPHADEDSLSFGKEFCNRGLCNPVYYTVGNLVKYLQQLKESGVEDIEERYAYLTASDCGSCRFTMYEAEYRKVLSEAGFPNFRVITFQYTGVSALEEEQLFSIDTKTYMRLLQAVIVGDFLQELSARIRPYEVIAGQTDRVISQARDIFYPVMKDRKKSIIKALKQTKTLIDTIEVDYTKVKPKVMIVGEFYAHTIEGAPNHNLLRWLESEGAEVEIPPMTGLLEMVLDSMELSTKKLLGLKNAGKGKLLFLLQVKFMRHLFHLYFNNYRRILGFYPSPLPSMKKLDKYTSSYYDTAFKGESYLEVAKHLSAFRDKKAHMVLSIKPFGCMPSTQSDGIHAKVMTDLDNSIFVSVETNGDSEVHFRSRILMKLFEAKNVAKEEFDAVMKDNGIPAEALIQYKANKKGSFKPHHQGAHHYTGTAANFILKNKRDIKKYRVKGATDAIEKIWT